MASITLFLRKIPVETNPTELEQFVERGFSVWYQFVGWVTRKPLVCEAKMLSLFDRNSDQAELHGIVTIQPHRAFHSVMTKLNNTLLKGHPIEVRRFYKRSPLNDRRLNRHIKIDDNAQNRRLADRRRKHLEIYKCYS